jgi:hypothetical protein
MKTQGKLAMDHLRSEEPLDMIKHVSFKLANETYALSAAKVNEVLSLNNQVSIANADLRAANRTLLDKNETIEGIKEEYKTKRI